MAQRNSDFDITDRVQVSSPQAVCTAVREIFAVHWPRTEFTPLGRAFDDFDALFSGALRGYVGCDTIYHDMQHSLDMTLTMARLMAGHDIAAAEGERIGGERALVGLVTALFHDSGYIRETDDDRVLNGAEYTMIHVSRSARYLQRYLPTIGLGDYAPVAGLMVHFTGYEMDFDGIAMPDDAFYLVGYMLGTADLMTQIADRCYLEKCRDRLFPEFVLAGIAMSRGADGELNVMYRSGQDLLAKTPDFFEHFAYARMRDKFAGVLRYEAEFFEGARPYHDAMMSNIEYMKRVMAEDDWSVIRRHPACFTIEGDRTLADARRLVAARLREMREELRAGA